MAIDPDIRIKLRHFWQKYNKVIIIAIVVFALIVVVNRTLVLNSDR